jgi:hypothetical protein
VGVRFDLALVRGYAAGCGAGCVLRAKCGAETQTFANVLPSIVKLSGTVLRQRICSFMTDRVTLIVQPGLRPAPGGTPVSVGVPYGSRARLILLYLQTEAVRTTRIAGVEGQEFAMLAKEPFGSHMFDYLSAFSGTIADGVNEIQRNIVADRRLGLTLS